VGGGGGGGLFVPQSLLYMALSSAWLTQFYQLPLSGAGTAVATLSRRLRMAVAASMSFISVVVVREYVGQVLTEGSGERGREGEGLLTSSASHTGPGLASWSGVLVHLLTIPWVQFYATPYELGQHIDRTPNERGVRSAHQGTSSKAAISKLLTSLCRDTKSA
jgi:hypothetical protein